MGTSENVSAPPAIMVDARPEIIFSAAAQIAALEEIHAFWNNIRHSLGVMMR